MPGLSDEREVVLVSCGELGSGAYEAHVLGLARFLSPHETVHQVALASPRFWLSSVGREALARERRRSSRVLSGRAVIVPHAVGKRLLGSSTVALAASARSLAAGVRAVRRGRGPLVLHCRGYLAAAIAARALRWIPRAALLHDVRGAREEEVRAFGGEMRPDRVGELEQEACAAADAHCCVSRPLATYLRERRGVALAEVFPCAADTERYKPDADARHDARHALGAGDDLVLGFVGHAAPWQLMDALPALLRSVRARRPARLLVLTPNVREMTAVLRAAGLSTTSPGEAPPEGGASAHVRAVAHDEVPAWLSACDATALLRQRDVINAVASPIKFGESLACGVPVLLTEGLGDASGVVLEHRVGAAFSSALLDGPDDEERLDRFLDLLADRPAISARCRAVAEELWSWDEQVPRWLALHERLAGSVPVTRTRC